MRFRWSIRSGASSTARSAPRPGRRHRLAAQFGALTLSEDPTESQVQGFQQRKGNLQEEIQVLDLEIGNLKQLRKKTEHHIPVKSLPEEDRFTRLRTEGKHFIDTLKMIAYRAESSMASLLREHMARGGDDARALLRQIFQTAADLTPDLAAKTLTVRLTISRKQFTIRPSNHCSPTSMPRRRCSPSPSSLSPLNSGHPDFIEIRRSERHYPPAIYNGDPHST
jgi:hypothetical protein